ncbi:hypothetical protein CR513_46688, partial [Mucuna pruriens]
MPITRQQASLEIRGNREEEATLQRLGGGRVSLESREVPCSGHKNGGGEEVKATKIVRCDKGDNRELKRNSLKQYLTRFNNANIFLIVRRHQSWYLDNGCLCHVTGERSMFQDLKSKFKVSSEEDKASIIALQKATLEFNARCFYLSMQNNNSLLYIISV